MPAIADDGKTWTVRLRKGHHVFTGPRVQGRASRADSRRCRLYVQALPGSGAALALSVHDAQQAARAGRLARAAKNGKLDYDARIPRHRGSRPLYRPVPIDRAGLSVRLSARAHGHGASWRARSSTRMAAMSAGIPSAPARMCLPAWTPGTRAVLDANPGYRGFVWDFAPGSDPRDTEIVAQMRGKNMPQIGHIELSIIEGGYDLLAYVLFGATSTRSPCCRDSRPLRWSETSWRPIWRPRGFRSIAPRSR